jgi:hypothetical protein
MAFLPITTLPDAPRRGDAPDTFTTKANDFVAALPEFVADVNSAGTYFDQKIVDAETAVSDCNQAVLDAQAQVTLAAGQVALAHAEFVAAQGVRSDCEEVLIDCENVLDSIQSTANFKGEWALLTGVLNMPSSVSHNNAIWNLLVNLPDVTASEPSLSNSDWFLTVSQVSEAPINGEQFVRQNGAWVNIDIPLQISTSVLSSTSINILDNQRIIMTSAGDRVVTLPVPTAIGNTVELVNTTATTTVNCSSNWAFSDGSTNGSLTVTGESWALIANFTDNTWHLV